MHLLVLLASLCVGLTLGQQQYAPTTTPVPILKQINRHNEDGSYSYGFEAADGSYKIESKYPTGEVYGKYGFVDDTGSVREIEYGATRRGFEPSGSGINVPPATVNSNSLAPGKDDPEDDGQYREDPSVYHTDPQYTNGERYDTAPKINPIYSHQQQQRPLSYSPLPSKSIAAAYRPAPVRAPAPAPVAAPAPVQPQYQPQYQQEYQPKYQTQYQPQQYQPQQYQAQPYSPQQYQPQQYQPAPVQQYQQPQYQQPQYQKPQYQQPQYPQSQYQQQYYNLNQFRANPAAANVDPNTGSYSIKYRR